jgi:hypothetical protein
MAYDLHFPHVVRGHSLFQDNDCIPHLELHRYELPGFWMSADGTGKTAGQVSLRCCAIAVPLKPVRT